jgi:hypothetical protein
MNLGYVESVTQRKNRPCEPLTLFRSTLLWNILLLHEIVLSSISSWSFSIEIFGLAIFSSLLIVSGLDQQKLERGKEIKIFPTSYQLRTWPEGENSCRHNFVLMACLLAKEIRVQGVTSKWTNQLIAWQRFKLHPYTVMQKTLREGLNPS